MSQIPDPLSVLKNTFGFDHFLPMQEEIISNVLAENDTLVLMPTGAGKSLCYQLPAMCLPGYTMVVSPLIALMKDQVDALRANGIPAAFVNSTLTASENEQVLSSAASGELKVLYVAPERIATTRFRSFLKAVPPTLIAIDEAHCISEWGHDFRPDYRNLKSLRRNLSEIPLIALTATATEQVRNDIADQLDLRESKWFVSSFNRPNLHYSVRPKTRSFEQLVQLLTKRRNESSIVYCFSRRETEDLAHDLNERGFTAAAYHAGLENSVRRSTQERFIKDEIDVIVATIAFGMGIDKPDVRLVVHYSLSKSLEGYYQETGRAGRDGLPSECVLFYSYSDKVKQDFFIDQIEDQRERQNAAEKLSAMVDYGELNTCRRAFMLSYFGDESQAGGSKSTSGDGCGGCDVCLAEKEEFDATEIAQKILSAIIRTGERFGAKHVTDVLRGSRAKRIVELQHDELSVHGIASEYTDPELRELFSLLQESGHIAVTTGEYRTLSVSETGRQFLNNRENLSLFRTPKEDDLVPVDGVPGKTNGKDLDYDRELFSSLRRLRKQIADERDVPAYVIFGDVALREMAYYLPSDLNSFSQISGVGSAKLDRFGDRFVELISEYSEQSGLTPRAKTGAPTRRRSSSRAGSRDSSGLSRSLSETKRLFTDGLSIEDIAAERGYKPQTIMSHLEKIGRVDPTFNLEPLLPVPEKFQAIEKVLRENEDGFLAPVKEILGDEFTYEEIRLVRLQLERDAGSVGD